MVIKKKDMWGNYVLLFIGELIFINGKMDFFEKYEIIDFVEDLFF